MNQLRYYNEPMNGYIQRDRRINNKVLGEILCIRRELSPAWMSIMEG